MHKYIYIYIYISIYIYCLYIYIYIRFCCLAFVCGAFALRDKSYEDFRDTYEVSGPLFHMEVLRGPPRYLRGVRVFCLEVLRGLWRHLRGVSCVFLRGRRFSHEENWNVMDIPTRYIPTAECPTRKFPDDRTDSTRI